MSAEVYAICPICRVSKRLRRDGCLPEHTRPIWHKSRTRCEGSGTTPASLPVTGAPA